MAKNESTAINALLQNLQARPVDRGSARNLFAVALDEDAVPEVPFVPKARAQATLQQPLPQIPSIATARSQAAAPAANKIRYAADSTPVRAARGTEAPPHRTARGTDSPPIARQLSHSAQQAAQPQHTPQPQPHERIVQSFGPAQPPRSAQHARESEPQTQLRDPQPRESEPQTQLRDPQPRESESQTQQRDPQPRQKFVPDAATVMERLGPVAETPDPDGRAQADAYAMPMVQSALPEHDDEETELWAAPPRPDLATATPAQVAAAAHLDALSQSGAQPSRRAAMAYVAEPMPVASHQPRTSEGEPSRSTRSAVGSIETRAIDPQAARSGAHVIARGAVSGAHAAPAARSGARAAPIVPARSAAHPAATPRDSHANAALARYIEASRRMAPSSRHATSRELVSTTVRYAGMAAVALIAIGIGIYLAIFSAGSDSLEPDRAVWIEVGASAPKMTVVKAPPPREPSEPAPSAGVTTAFRQVAEPAKATEPAAELETAPVAESTTEPAKAEPTSEPAKPEPAAELKAEPVKAEPAKTEPESTTASTEIDESEIEMEPTIAKRPRRSSRRAVAAAIDPKPTKLERTKPERKLTKAEAEDPVLAVVRSKPKADKPGPATPITAPKGAAPAKGNGKVTITSNVAAIIFVDGRPTGKSAPAALILPAGDHSITLLDPATKKAKTASVKVDPTQGASIRKDFN